MLSNDDVTNITDYLAPLIDELSERHNVLFVLNRSKRVGFGGTSRFSDERNDHAAYLSEADDILDGADVVWLGQGKPDYVVSIGVRELYSRFGQVVMSRDVTLAALLTSVFHEMRHVQQYNVGRGYEQRPDDMPPDAVWSLVASCDNSEMYRKNYRSMSHEVDAECVGRIGAYDFMVDAIGLQSAQRAMSVFSLYSTSFGLGPMRDLDFSSFDKQGFADKAKALIRNVSKSFRNVRCLLDGQSSDFAARYFSLNEQGRKVFFSLRTGAEQDVYLAKINVEFNDKERAFFDRDALLLPDTVPEPAGGVLTKPVAVADERRPIEGVFFDDATDDELQL